MRESYRSKRSRQAKFQAEKEKQFEERRSGKDRREFTERRMQDRRSGERRNFDRGEPDRRKGERRQGERRQGERRAQELEANEYEDVVAGRNAVIELLNSDRDINKIFIANGEKHGSITKIIAMAKENKIVTVEVEKSKLDLMAENHQGVVAVVPPFNYCEIEDILDVAKERGEDPFVLILDGIEDPHNLGSIIRTAETAGVHGVIIPKRRSVTVNSTVSKVSAGAVEHMKVARVSNINDSIRKLKE